MAAKAAVTTTLANSSAENKLYDTEKELSYLEFVSDVAVFLRQMSFRYGPQQIDDILQAFFHGAALQ